ncbi:gamma-glutamyl hydrolase A-like isoform X1 [Homalodisca vitripennis]|uniref:gamma-glutamyl hydrolase A-like isoform X1 n=2 Tax=Homalodisca vitripennis TaxID=197043 RepID=UPI001EEB1184|nr:gamma-glutamyl hydrolase A-like isoform X1 [Homalodisca vitripennis]
MLMGVTEFAEWRSKMALTLLVFLLSLGLVQATKRPIIGILTEEVYHEDYPDYSSMIVGSYVKAVEQSGARVVPIFINRTEDYYRDILDSVNGVLFPGGGLSFLNVGGYADAGRIILNYTKQVNSAGEHFPLVGVCLGFELLFYLEVESYDILGYCNATNLSLPLIFKENIRESKLYRQAPRQVIEILQNLPVTYNHHKRCVTEGLLKEFHLNKEWHVLSTSVDSDGKKFISSVESNTYPIVGIQFHPEKNAFEWNPTQDIAHTKKAIYSARYFNDWLVNEARKNDHSFNSSDTESSALIYNYNATFINKGKSYYEQIYFFY